jgi:hypothetical protein
MDEQTTARVVWPQDAWRLRLLLDAPSLNPPVVQYAIFSENPVSRFAADLERVEKACREQLRETHDPDLRKTVRRSQLASVWNRLFRAVRGDEVYLVAAGCSDLALMSNAPPGNKWLVTKAVQIGGRPFCWNVAFEAIQGREATVNLREDNSLDLATLDRGRDF